MLIAYREFPSSEGLGVGLNLVGTSRDLSARGHQLQSLYFRLSNYRLPSLDYREREFEGSERSSEGQGWLDPVLQKADTDIRTRRSARRRSPKQLNENPKTKTPPLLRQEEGELYSCYTYLMCRFLGAGGVAADNLAEEDAVEEQFVGTIPEGPEVRVIWHRNDLACA
ncbi:hypothetical protein SAMN05421739_10848 [Pontibacter chinhatensis]|uniref:Uncharacterized protein n=1 Tax=Pontibacter chinhatensis TaxID=1436961 RepID=A0A1I2YI93_9BACT|nr:hypothetical protein SAMN05421739_10848 [Pontibacter chinhatensis]